MDDAHGVRRFQRFGYLHPQVENSARGQGFASDQVLQGRAFHQLHHQEGLPVGLVYFIHRADVRMIERGSGARLPLESRQHHGNSGQVRGQELQRHFPAQTEVFRRIHHPHAAPTQPLQNAVVGNRLAHQPGDIRTRWTLALGSFVARQLPRCHLQGGQFQQARVFPFAGE